MKNFLRLLDERRLPFELGNVMLPVRRYLSILPTASRLEKRVLYAELRAQLGNRGMPLNGAELACLRQEIANIAEAPPFDKERQALLALLADRAPSSFSPKVGEAQVLFVSTESFQGKRFGLAQPIEILSEPWGDRVDLLNPADDEAVYRGFQQGVWAAQQYLLAEGLGTPQGARLIKQSSIKGVFPNLPPKLPVAGPSIGLGTAVGTVSRLLDLPVPPGVGFTGHVDPTGQLHPVAGIEPKLEAAADKGLETIFLPEANVKDVPSGLRDRLAVRPASALAAVLGEVFGPEDIRQGIQRLQRMVTPAPAWAFGDSWLPEADTGAPPNRVLLTCVGRADPIGRYLDRERKALPVQEEGPILTICRWINPHAVYLFYTTYRPDNDFTDKARAVTDSLELALPGSRIYPVPLSTITDPSDYQQLWPAFEAAVRHIVSEESSSGAAYYVNLASGSPQMETVWHWLAGNRVLRACLLQVREGRYVRPGDSRVRQVVLPILGEHS